MKLTKEYLLSLLDEVTKDKEFDYVKPGNSKVKILAVDKINSIVSLQRKIGRAHV